MSFTNDWLLRILPWAGMALFGLGLVVFAAAAEMAFASVSRAQIRQRLAAQKSWAKAAELAGAPVRLLSTLLLLKLIGFMLVTTATIFLAQALGQGAGVGWWLLGAIMLLLFGHSCPAWTIGREERMALRLARTASVLAFMVSPFTALMRRIGHSAVPQGQPRRVSSSARTGCASS